MITSEPRLCPRCKAVVPADAPQGMCPRCLLQGGLSAASEPSSTAAHSGPFTAPSVAELARVFPQLDVLEPLGAGGMGAVYKARQPHLDRLVALKILPPEAAADPTFAERFGREARTLARLNHPHVVGIHDFGQAGGYYYLLMEYVDGTNLRQVMRSGDLTPAQALRIVAQVCDALQFAHEEGVVHRDIKPENILLDKRGWVKIADFGLAKMLSKNPADLSLTGTRQAVGTPHYMAPEQMEKPTTVDHRADIYSLGVVFYELLTGELPLGRFAPPSKKAPVDARLDEVVLRTLAKEPEQRYQQVSEVKTEVETIDREPPPPKPERPGAEKEALVVAAPADKPAAPPDPVQQMVAWPAKILEVTSLTETVALAAFLMAAWLSAFVNFFSRRGGGNDFLETVWLLVLSMVPAPLIWYGARKMKELRGYRWAVAACVLALLPCSFFTPVLLPAGLWGLCVLAQTKVRQAFRE